MLWRYPTFNYNSPAIQRSGPVRWPDKRRSDRVVLDFLFLLHQGKRKDKQSPFKNLLQMKPQKLFLR
jgi:hypothetical protein